MVEMFGGDPPKPPKSTAEDPLTRRIQYFQSLLADFHGFLTQRRDMGCGTSLVW